ncbi:unnamed protein product [Bathycoccus prasinos]
MTKWSMRTLRTNECRAMVEGQEAHRLFEAPDLHEMARTGDLDGMRRLILSKDDDDKVNALDPAGRTPLHFAAGFGRVACVKFLLERGAKLEVRDLWSKAPVDWALQSKHEECVKLMRIKAIETNLEIGGRGQVSPLRTYHEYCYDLTTEEVEERLEQDRKTAMEQYEKMSEEERKQFRESNGVDPAQPVPF